MSDIFQRSLIFVVVTWAILVFSSSASQNTQDLKQYDPNWDSLDSRPLPDWFDKAKIGIFIHWGVFSVPSMGTEWFWAFINDGGEVTEYLKNYFAPGFSYQQFAKDFTAEFFNPTEWAELFAKAGAKLFYQGRTIQDFAEIVNTTISIVKLAKARAYGVLIKFSPFIKYVGELGEAVRAQNLTYGLYHSLLEWYHPLYQVAKNTNYEDRRFAETKAMPELYELVNTYQPSIIWSDGAWEAPDTYWNATEFIAWLYNESPVKDFVVTNDRWGKDITCKHGGYFTCNDRYSPTELQSKKWENAMSLDRTSFGYRRNAKFEDYLSIDELLIMLVKTVAYGGNILINIGPGHDGTINMIFQDRLLQLGYWLSINGEAIYESHPWLPAQKDTNNDEVYYTTRDGYLYALLLSWPRTPEVNVLLLGSVADVFNNTTTTVSLLGYQGGDLEWTLDSTEIVKITLPELAYVTTKFAWVLKITSRYIAAMA